MSKALLLRLHRWIAVIFAIPLAIIIVTGLLLSLQPLLQAASVKPASITLDKIEGWMQKYDADGKARALSIDTYNSTLTLGGGRGDRGTVIDTRTGAETADRDTLSEIIRSSRSLHEHFLFDQRWVVTWSTVAMLFIIVIGTFMGLPRMANTMAGWHKITAWILLPLLALSALSGLFMALGLTFSDPLPRGKPVPISDAVRMLAAKHDLSGLDFIRERGGRQMARISDGTTQRTYLVTPEGLKPAPLNLPRTFHEGVFFGMWGGVMNLILSLAFALLLTTGLIIWGRRTFRRRQRTRRPQVAGAAAE
ncbi:MULTISPECIES: PepSY-associated TM helix domain-containing protein [unclassified Beijerinckia]|uniref:PepSY-associated TM helix domain-containing protein n=1 Tax=unclassified Beijerinckia TaxID=2638183 RepID=UPI00089470E7|nr:MULTISPECIES: PepSY-associated TM helix domain-containing protein [unclassified Beijerinckia]MDH7794185.1 putative iron-regulated membrane protein [Beijerinckia sp. GAS462]SEB55255.1 PepSY-associated TM region [Beijerinckia sp. 28-YEA-48]